jgi:phytoene synthase
MSRDSTLSYCARELCHHDRDRYLTCLFAPAARREALFALYAFNLEIAKTAEVVSEPMLGQLRLQWWREALDEIYNKRPQRHEVSRPLAAAVRAHGLTRRHFEDLIDARAFDLEQQAPESLAKLEDYAQATSAGLVLLALEILGVKDEASRAAGRQIGIAWALTGLLRAVPFHARHQRLYLPRDLCAAAGLDPQQLFALRAPPGSSEVIGQVAARARAHLAEARALKPRVAKAALPALLPATLVARYLSVLERAGQNPFRPEVQANAPLQVWRLAWAALARRY